LIQIVGLLLFGSGAVKAVQLLIGRRSADLRQRSWPVIVCQVALDVLMGTLIINHWRASVSVVSSAFGLLFLCEGLLLVYMALRSPTAHSRLMLAASGVAAGAVGVAILARLVDDPMRWAGVFVGLKLLTFGGALTLIAWRAPKSNSAILYELE